MHVTGGQPSGKSVAAVSEARSLPANLIRVEIVGWASVLGACTFACPYTSCVSVDRRQLASSVKRPVPILRESAPATLRSCY